MAKGNRTGRGTFQPGDRRINRDGRPKGSTDLAALTRRIAHEVATKKDGSPVLGPDGRPLTVIEAILRQWAQNPKQQEQFVERGFGKVPQQQQLTGADGEAIRVLQEVVIGGTQAPGQQAPGTVLDEPSA